MRNVLREPGQMAREALRAWPGLFRLLCVLTSRGRRLFPVNEDLLPRHAGINAVLDSARQEHVRRLATTLNLEDGLKTILTPR